MSPERLTVMGAGLTTYKNGNRSCNSEVGAARMGKLGTWEDLWHSCVFCVFFFKHFRHSGFWPKIFFPESFPWQFSGPGGKHWDIHQMWLFRVPGRMLHATCKKCPSWFFQKLLMNTLTLKGLLRVSKVVEYKVSDTGPHRNSYFSSPSWTKVPTWKLQVSGRML